ncbi:NADH-quinone oxidoreductase subunit G [Magnetospirillum gryphiswaldense MSR-1 v2]|uniref:NADH-quinone oxidoreductase n=1 Tax=Magnetospirillum gryphiswaldense (strain DSM 6361 / JCM 21280 / NBRC 15271 / MSR-1) TaxID=431944 RepID=V6F2M1_MAGGM|nr:NADH-quinone oxidoreductase subunit NuoG [Magnetospirillum gryphiswaldense]CDK98536.1 NADH-quinone oxidoreductase subunit G [Magnetospirillum gryphiswaldense MSR-1 v2]
MPKLTIDGTEIEVEAGVTILQAAETIGIEIPRFCYHERLAVAGNCRMCLVEVEKMPKPVASCAMPVGEGMVVHTNNANVRKARQGVMEFLLINHPLDCPICDQGGECDLQDQAMTYGGDRSRYQEEKRAVEDKNYGPLIQTWMTRCIQCTRCIRFISEIAGTPVLGGLGRSEHLEIGRYVGAAVSSELSGNLIDLCPVGALTNKPASYTYRAWELKKTESVDAMDALGSAIRVDTRGNEVIRILPRVNDDINEEWLSDRSRFAVDGLKRQRLDRAYVRKDGKLAATSWSDAFAAIAGKVKGVAGSKIAAIAGDQTDVETMQALKDLLIALGSGNMDCRQDGAKLAPGNRAGYLFNSTIAGIEEADALLIIGSNPRVEAPVLNARIRKRWLKGGFKAAVIGPKTDLTFKHDWLGEQASILADIVVGTHPFAEVLKNAAKPAIILGQGALARGDGAAILALAGKLAEASGVIKDGWNGFNVLHTAASRVGGLDVGFVPQAGGKDTAGIIAGAASGDISVVFLAGADEVDMKGFGNAFVVYLGTHGDAGAHRADVVLPTAAYTEKSATYVNTEGRVQRTRLAIFPPGEAKEDWKVIRALSDALDKPLAFDTVKQLRERMVASNPVFASEGVVKAAAWTGVGTAGALTDKPLASAIDNFYMVDPISRASKTMAECTAEFGGGCGCNSKKKTGTHG